MAEPLEAGGRCAQPQPAAGSSKIDITKLCAGLGVPALHADEIIHNILYAETFQQSASAQTYSTHWRACPDADSEAILPATYVTIRRTHITHCSALPASEQELQEQDRQSALAQRLELNLRLHLHKTGCDTRLAELLAVFNYTGQWYDDPGGRAALWYEPTNGYVMRAYPLGTVSKLLQNICYGRVPLITTRRFLSLRTVAAEYDALLKELHKMRAMPGVDGMMVQDLSPANLVVDDGPNDTRLLVANSALVQPTLFLQEMGRRSKLCGTWLWGSMLTRHGQFDPSNDLYSLSFTFAEIWLVAEGAEEAPADLITRLGLDRDKAQGVQFMRRLVWEVLRLHHRGATGITPRVPRPLPVSWLGAWLLLLGFRDYGCEEHMRKGLPCLRPENEYIVLEASKRWARIVDAAQGLPTSMSVEQLLSPAYEGLLGDIALLLFLLIDMSYLLQAGEQEDPALAWCAANFMEQKHPLVAALRARGAEALGEPDSLYNNVLPEDGWQQAVQRAREGVLHGLTPEAPSVGKAKFARLDIAGKKLLDIVPVSEDEELPMEAVAAEQPSSIQPAPPPAAFEATAPQFAPPLPPAAVAPAAAAPSCAMVPDGVVQPAAMGSSASTAAISAPPGGGFPGFPAGPAVLPSALGGGSNFPLAPLQPSLPLQPLLSGSTLGGSVPAGAVGGALPAPPNNDTSQPRKKRKLDGTVPGQGGLLPADAEAVGQLLGVPGELFEPSTAQKRRAAFIRWWLGGDELETE